MVIFKFLPKSATQNIVFSSIEEQANNVTGVATSRPIMSRLEVLPVTERNEQR